MDCPVNELTDGVRADERFNLATQIRIAGARLIEKGNPFCRRQVERGLKNLIDLFRAFWVHGSGH